MDARHTTGERVLMRRVCGNWMSVEDDRSPEQTLNTDGPPVLEMAPEGAFFCGAQSGPGFEDRTAALLGAMPQAASCHPLCSGAVTPALLAHLSLALWQQQEVTADRLPRDALSCCARWRSAVGRTAHLLRWCLLSMTLLCLLLL